MTINVEILTASRDDGSPMHDVEDHDEADGWFKNGEGDLIVYENVELPDSLRQPMLSQNYAPTSQPQNYVAQYAYGHWTRVWRS